MTSTDARSLRRLAASVGTAILTGTVSGLAGTLAARLLTAVLG